MLFSTALFFSAFIFMVVATPTPAFTVEKRQGDRQIILTLAPNYLVTLDQSHTDVIGGSQYTGDVSWTPGQSNELTTIVGWDIPRFTGATECYIRFTLPPASGSFAWVVNGAGIMDFYRTSRPVNPLTDSWNNRPTRLCKQGTATVHGGTEGGEATITGQFLDCTTLAEEQRFDLEFVAARVGDVQNRVETFRMKPPALSW
ncbi:hypothetical protein Q9L58_009078 [Maublancomyces gigas]|uniref:Ubiquitin 3 binding protein But2 C-terminal domain-containing protein n=1 Tax=Discina gigas TaxID=1032678 RepID=A0ABR3G7X6_9PEZI